MVCLKRLTWGVVVGAGVAVAQATVPTTTGLSPPLILGGSSCSSTEWRLSIAGGLPGGLRAACTRCTRRSKAFSAVSSCNRLVSSRSTRSEDGVTVVDVSLMNQWGDLRGRRFAQRDSSAVFFIRRSSCSSCQRETARSLYESLWLHR